MSDLTSVWKIHLQNFYEYKLLCGYKYDSSGKVLHSFDQYYNSLKINDMKFSREIVEPFLYLNPNERISNQSFKACVLRQFGKYLFINNIIDKIYIIPPISQRGESEYIPYIYDKKELRDIIRYLENYKASTIPGTFPLYPNMLNGITLTIKILMTTGMRLGEVINLKMKNIDFVNSLLYIDVAKNDNQRIVPISDTLKEEILDYIENTPFVLDTDGYLLYSNYGNRIRGSNAQHYFRKALKACGIRNNKDSCRTRLHDCRHTFAVMSLTQLQKNEDNINASLSYLSTYLGHKSFHETQKYIWLTPLLFNDVKNKMKEYSSCIMDIFGGDKFDED